VAAAATLTSQDAIWDSGKHLRVADPETSPTWTATGPLQVQRWVTPTRALHPQPCDRRRRERLSAACHRPAGLSRPEDGNGDGIAACDIGAYELAGSPACPAAARPWPSIACRLDDLIPDVQPSLHGTLRDRLNGILTSQGAGRAGGARRWRMGMKHRTVDARRATGSLASSRYASAPGRAQHQIPGDALAGMKSANDQLRHD